MAVKVRKSGAWVDVSVATTSGTTKVARLYDAKSSSTGAGTPPDTAYQNRTLNTKDDPNNFVTLDSGNVYFSMAAGSYEINWRAPAYDAGGFRSKLVYANNSSFTSSSEVLGESGLANTTDEDNNYNCGTAILTTTETTYFKIQQAQASGTWGAACGVGGVEIYTQVFVEDLATAVKDNATYVEGNIKVAKLYDAKTQNTAGGSYDTADGWVNRTLNTETDPNGFVNLDSGNVYFSVGAGTYKIKWDTPSYMLGNYQSRLQYDDNSSFTSPTSVVGSTEFATTNAGVLNTIVSSDGIAVLTVTETTYFRIQVKGSATPGDSNALGKPANLDTEIYTQVSVEDLATAVKDDGSLYIKQIQHASGPATQTSYNSGTWTTIVEKSITLSEDNKVLINVKAGFYGGDEGTAYQGGRIVRTTSSSDTTVLEITSIWGRVGAGTNFKASIDGPTYEESPGVGTHTYKWQTRQHNAADDNDVIVFANGNSITLTEIVN